MRLILTTLTICVLSACSDKKDFDAKIEYAIEKYSKCRFSKIINTSKDKILTYTIFDSGSGRTELISLFPGEIKQIGCSFGKDGFKVVGQVEGEKVESE